MKRSLSRTARAKAAGRRAKGAAEPELERGWQELEAQHDRLKSDWASLAAQLGIGGKSYNV
ncbi:MAG: hypothetical protein HY552_03410 [Elusimicrobia bacterium]|nr:hypothetical protein [Elusimicrobiota bacterium]